MEQINRYELKAKAYKTKFEKTKITNSQDAYNVIRKFYSDDINIFESFFLLMLNISNETIGYAKISQGGVTGTVVDVKIVAKYCIDSLCSSAIVAHNHPSGNLNASEADIKITKKINEALKLIDVNLLDSLIITDTNFTEINFNHHITLNN